MPFAIPTPYYGVMATTKITITVDDNVLAGVKAAVDDGHADNVSAYITEATAQRVAREARAEQIEQRWGPFSPKAMAWARKAAGTDLESGRRGLPGGDRGGAGGTLKSAKSA